MVGSEQNIMWTSSNVRKVKIEYRTGFSSGYRVLIDSVDATLGSISIFVPNPSTESFKIKITSVDSSSIFAESDSITTTEPENIWEPILTVSGIENVNDIFQTGENEGWVATGQYLKKTTNSGTTWADINTGVANPFHSLYFLNKDTGAGLHQVIVLQCLIHLIQSNLAAIWI